jgi:hypothetical protein
MITINTNPKCNVNYSVQLDYHRLFEICFHFAGHRSSTQEFSAGPSEFNQIVKNIPYVPLYTSHISDMIWNHYAFQNSWYES